MPWRDVCTIAALTLILAGCATDEEQPAEADAAPAEEPSFLPQGFDPGAGIASTPSNLPERDYSSIQFVGWERHPGRAMQAARSQQRPLLILFTALAWNENAKKLGDEVFLSRTFNNFARKNLVLSFLDYPQSVGQAPDSMRMMKERYEVTGFPTLLLLDHAGKELWRRKGYVPGKARDYFEELQTAVERIDLSDAGE